MKKSSLILGLAILAFGLCFSYVNITHGQSEGRVVNGVCGGYGTCSAGTASAVTASQGTTYTGTWSCAGINGGNSASCSGNSGQFSTPGVSYSWSGCGASAVCLESGNGISVSTGYCAGSAPSCAGTATTSGSTSSGTGNSTAGTASGGVTSSAGSSLCITAPAPTQGSYSVDFYTQMDNACQQVFAQAEDQCVASGKGFCTYNNQALAYNCGMANSGGGIGYCLPGETPAANGCIQAMTPAQIEAALGGVTCPGGSVTPSGGSSTPTSPASAGSAGSPGTGAGSAGSSSGSAGSVGGSTTSFTATLNSALGAISIELQRLHPASSTPSSASSCSTSDIATTLTGLVSALQGAASALSTSNASPAILQSVESLITSISQALPALSSCTR